MSSASHVDRQLDRVRWSPRGTSRPFVDLVPGPQLHAALVLALRKRDHAGAVAGSVDAVEGAGMEPPVGDFHVLLGIAGRRIPGEMQRRLGLLVEHADELRLLDLVEDALVGARTHPDEAAV